METCLHIKEENKASKNSSAEEQSGGEETFLQIGAGKRTQDDDGMNPTATNLKNLTSSKQGLEKIERSSPDYKSQSRSYSSAKTEQLDSAKAEMDEVMEENQKLRLRLDRILKEYRTLQDQYRDAIRQECTNIADSVPTNHNQTEENELISLSLGRSSSDTIKNVVPKMSIKDQGGLSLGLDCKFEVPKMLERVEPSSNSSLENSLEEVKNEGGETWPPRKIMKNSRDGGDQDDEILQQNPAKKARVSVRFRCDTPTMNDGCQWRKYGQKISKGNPCPRAYYRCTVAPSCPVRKQVQRCVDDMTILITTYEGTHNHPLPVSATAMASTTSAAVSMLNSGSSTTTAATTAATSNLNGLNFYLSDNSRTNPYYLPNSSISSTLSHPTITLDLTSTSATSSSSHIRRLGSYPPRYSTTNLNFSSLESNPPPLSWSNGVLSYGTQPLHMKNQTSSSLSFGAQNNENLYQSYLQKNNVQNPNQQSNAQDYTMAAATKAITSDPNFQSALAAALTSIIGSGISSTNTFGNQNVGENPIQNIKASEPFPVLSSYPSTSNSNKFSPSFMNKSSSSTTSSQPEE